MGPPSPQTLYVRRHRTGRTTGWCLHSRRDCPALSVVADSQIESFHGTAGEAMDAYSNAAYRQDVNKTTFLLCDCMVTDPSVRLPTRPPLHARITIERDPDAY